MTITVKRRHRGENRFGPGGGSHYYIAITDDPDNEDEIDAMAAVVADAPPTVNGIQLFGVDTRERLKNDRVAAWLCEARYGAGGSFATAPSPTRPGFVATLASEKIIRSRTVVASGVSGGGTAPARDNLIGVNDEGQAEGTEILRPIFTIPYSVELTDTQVNTTYAAAWAAAVGTVNLLAYKGYPPGSLLFQGVQAEPQAQGGYTARLEFGYRKTETMLEIGDGMTLATLAGWDYLDIVPMPEFDTTIEAIIAKADYYYVHRNYEFAAWGDLGV